MSSYSSPATETGHSFDVYRFPGCLLDVLLTCSKISILHYSRRLRKLFQLSLSVLKKGLARWPPKPPKPPITGREIGEKFQIKQIALLASLCASAGPPLAPSAAASWLEYEKSGAIPLDSVMVAYYEISLKIASTLLNQQESCLQVEWGPGEPT